MCKLANRDYQHVLDAILMFYHYTKLRDMQQSVLRELSTMFHAESANFFMADSNSGLVDLTNVVSFNIDKSYIDQYSRYYYRHDPFLSLDPRRVVCRKNDIAPDSSWVRLEFYNDFLKLQNIYHLLGIYLYSGEELLGLIGLHRPKGYPAFCEKDVARAHTLANHLAIALKNIRVLSKLEQEKRLLNKASQLCPLGILVLDWSLHPVYWNSQAREVCFPLSRQRSEGASTAGEYLVVPPELVEDCSNLKNLFLNGSQAAACHCQRILYAGGEGKLWVTCSLVQQPLSQDSAPCFLVYIENPLETQKVKEVKQELIFRRYDLTRREKEIIQYLRQGLTDEEISRRLFISRSTVASHLQNIFEKTGIRSRTKLLSQIGFP